MGKKHDNRQCICQILSKSGREEQATLVSITGIVIVLVMIMGQLSQLITTVKTVFGL